MTNINSLANAVIDRPALVLQTVYFHDSERPDAMRLGQDLYEQLTRPANDPLAFGAGIPVLSAVAGDRVDLGAAELVVVIPVLGKSSFLAKQQLVVSELGNWHKRLGAGHLLVVPTAPVWHKAEDKLPGRQLLAELYASDDPRRRTLDEIVVAVSRLLEPDRKSVRLFISHAEADASDAAAKQIHDYVVTDTTGRAFFDAVGLRPGESLSDQLHDAVGEGVFIAVRGDSYSSRNWCQAELLTAKLHQLPSLTVDVLQRGEQRSSPYGGNGPSVVWDGNAAAIASQAMIQWLRSAYFRREAKRLAKFAGLPDDLVVLAHPPELLDLAQGALSSVHARLAMHPDPELPVMERQILKAARPRLQLVTPTTAFRRLLNREGISSTVTSPLEGRQVAMSLSDSPDVNGPEGFTAEHLRDATIYLARSLVSAGAAIAYGGDFRTNGFTPLLAELIEGYNQTAAQPAEFLHSYLGAPIQLADAPDDLALTVHHLVDSTDVARDAMLPPPSDKERHPAALYFSDVRQVMAKRTFARIVLGGAAEPRLEAGGSGYGGRYPGVAEEAWRTLEAGKPLYVVGGFGGAAALVADLFEGGAIPDRLQDKTWKGSTYFAQNAAAIDIDPYRQKLGLPERIEELATAIRDLARTRLADDAESLSWNGLTVDENRRLWRTRDPAIIASLVLQGLLNVAREQATGKLQIELVQGSVTAGSHLDAVAVGVFDKIPLGGAGAALDQAIGGRASASRAEGRALISMESPEVDADWLYLASLGPLENVNRLEQRVEQAARETANQSRRHGFQRLGVVAFGGSVITDVRLMVEAMLRGFADLCGHTTIVWFETDADRFGRLQKMLTEQPQVQLTTHRAVASAAAPRGHEEELILQVSLRDNQLTVTTLPPAGSAIAASRRVEFTDAEAAALSEGRGRKKRVTPDLQTLNERGAQLAEKLFGDEATQLLTRCRDARTMIIHDVAASKLPFEMLATADGSSRPATRSGISRRLAVEGVPTERLFAKPPQAGRLNVLLIVNPTEDLPGTEEEAEAVKQILEQSQDRVKLKVLPGEQATRKAVQAALAEADVLHYCGHAFFDGPGRDESGLILAGNELLTLADLESVYPLPRIAFVNACEAGRVRGSTTTEAAAFAELFLRSGVEAYLGTYWEVGDTAAASFSTGVYSRLAEGQTLESAVTKSRAELLKNNEPDWANYILYGDGRFKLVLGS
jgi:CHAT domain-containing protein